MDSPNNFNVTRARLETNSGRSNKANPQSSNKADFTRARLDVKTESPSDANDTRGRFDDQPKSSNNASETTARFEEKTSSVCRQRVVCFAPSTNQRVQAMQTKQGQRLKKRQKVQTTKTLQW